MAHLIPPVMRTLAACALMCPAVALAQSCPQTPVNDAPLRLTRADPFMQIDYTSTAEGLREDRTMEVRGLTRDSTTLYAHPLVPARLTSDQTKITMRYDAPLQGIETLDRDKKWESGYTVSSDGEELFKGRFTLSYKRSANVVIGECRYNVWVVEARMYRPELYSNFEQLYAPKLGIVLGSVAKNAEDTPVSGVFFDHIERGL
ncbi:hypothetical protein HCZ97_12035 [Pseudooceanicola sp. HF7]|nr:hypothetical protein [Pseudooceanicola sp. HF7]